MSRERDKVGSMFIGRRSELVRSSGEDQHSWFGMLGGFFNNTEIVRSRIVNSAALENRHTGGIAGFLRASTISDSEIDGFECRAKFCGAVIGEGVDAVNLKGLELDRISLDSKTQSNILIGEAGFEEETRTVVEKIQVGTIVMKSN